MTAVQVLSEVRAAGGRLTALPPDRLRYEIPHALVPRLEPEIRAHKFGLLALLKTLELPCIACAGMYRWQDSVGDWHCGHCEPDQRANRLRGVDLAVLGDRNIVRQPPASDMPEPGSWARTPAGAVVELVLFEVAGAEVLCRELRSGRLGWFAPSALLWEADWGWSA